MPNYKFDTQLLIESCHRSEDQIQEDIQNSIAGDCLLVVGDEELMKLHFHTDTPWKLLEYCAGLGDLFDIVVENMARQENGQKG